jgi:hypothetical protein
MIHNNAMNIISNVTINKNVRRTRNIRTFGTVEHSDELLFNEQLVNLRLQKKKTQNQKYKTHQISFPYGSY